MNYLTLEITTAFFFFKGFVTGFLSSQFSLVVETFVMLILSVDFF